MLCHLRILKIKCPDAKNGLHSTFIHVTILIIKIILEGQNLWTTDYGQNNIQATKF